MLSTDDWRDSVRQWVEDHASQIKHNRRVMRGNLNMQQRNELARLVPGVPRTAIEFYLQENIDQLISANPFPITHQQLNQNESMYPHRTSNHYSFEATGNPQSYRSNRHLIPDNPIHSTIPRASEVTQYNVYQQGHVTSDGSGSHQWQERVKAWTLTQKSYIKENRNTLGVNFTSKQILKLEQLFSDIDINVLFNYIIEHMNVWFDDDDKKSLYTNKPQLTQRQIANNQLYSNLPWKDRIYLWCKNHHTSVRQNRETLGGNLSGPQSKELEGLCPEIPYRYIYKLVSSKMDEWLAEIDNEKKTTMIHQVENRSLQKQVGVHQMAQSSSNAMYGIYNTGAQQQQHLIPNFGHSNQVIPPAPGLMTGTQQMNNMIMDDSGMYRIQQQAHDQQPSMQPMSQNTPMMCATSGSRNMFQNNQTPQVSQLSGGSGVNCSVDMSTDWRTRVFNWVHTNIAQIKHNRRTYGGNLQIKQQKELEKMCSDVNKSMLFSYFRENIEIWMEDITGETFVETNGEAMAELGGYAETENPQPRSYGHSPLPRSYEHNIPSCSTSDWRYGIENYVKRNHIAIERNRLRLGGNFTDKQHKDIKALFPKIKRRKLLHYVKRNITKWLNETKLSRSRTVASTDISAMSSLRSSAISSLRSSAITSREISRHPSAGHSMNRNFADPEPPKITSYALQKSRPTLAAMDDESSEGDPDVPLQTNWTNDEFDASTEIKSTGTKSSRTKFAKKEVTISKPDVDAEETSENKDRRLKAAKARILREKVELNIPDHEVVLEEDDEGIYDVNEPLIMEWGTNQSAARWNLFEEAEVKAKPEIKEEPVKPVAKPMPKKILDSTGRSWTKKSNAKLAHRAKVAEKPKVQKDIIADLQASFQTKLKWNNDSAPVKVAHTPESEASFRRNFVPVQQKKGFEAAEDGKLDWNLTKPQKLFELKHDMPKKKQEYDLSREVPWQRSVREYIEEHKVKFTTNFRRTQNYFSTKETRQIKRLIGETPVDVAIRWVNQNIKSWIDTKFNTKKPAKTEIESSHDLRYDEEWKGVVAEYVTQNVESILSRKDNEGTYFNAKQKLKLKRISNGKATMREVSKFVHDNITEWSQGAHKSAYKNSNPHFQSVIYICTPHEVQGIPSYQRWFDLVNTKFKVVDVQANNNAIEGSVEVLVRVYGDEYEFDKSELMNTHMTIALENVQKPVEIREVEIQGVRDPRKHMTFFIIDCDNHQAIVDKNFHKETMSNIERISSKWIVKCQMEDAVECKRVVEQYPGIVVPKSHLYGFDLLMNYINVKQYVEDVKKCLLKVLPVESLNRWDVCKDNINERGRIFIEILDEDAAIIKEGIEEDREAFLKDVVYFLNTKTKTPSNIDLSIEDTKEHAVVSFKLQHIRMSKMPIDIDGTLRGAFEIIPGSISSMNYNVQSDFITISIDVRVPDSYHASELVRICYSDDWYKNFEQHCNQKFPSSFKRVKIAYHEDFSKFTVYMETSKEKFASVDLEKMFATIAKSLEVNPSNISIGEVEEFEEGIGVSIQIRNKEVELKTVQKIVKPKLIKSFPKLSILDINS